MQKLELPDVTLVSITSIRLPETIKALQICCANIKFARVLLLTSEAVPPADWFEVGPAPRMNNTEDYSRFAIRELHRRIHTSHLLIVQWDGFVLNPVAWEDEFHKYDYIGSPWPMGFNVGDPWDGPTGGPYRVGNGGFSFRSKRCMELASQFEAEGRCTRSDPEDMIISIDMAEYLKERGIKFAPVAVAARFSLEKWYNGSRKWNGQFGFHQFTFTDISRWTKANPQWEVKNVFKSPRPYLVPWKKNFWKQFKQPRYLLRQVMDMMR